MMHPRQRRFRDMLNRTKWVRNISDGNALPDTPPAALGLDEEDDVEEGDDDEVEYNAEGCSSWCASIRAWKFVASAIGIGLLGGGAVVEVVEGNLGLSRGLLIPGAFLLLILVAKSIVKLAETVAASCLHRARGARISLYSTTVYYISVTRGPVEGLTWGILSLAAFTGLVPRQVDLQVSEDWDLVYFHVTRVLIILSLFFGARVTTIVLRLRFSLGIHNSAYDTAVKVTMFHEYLLNKLARTEPRPWFNTLYDKFSGGHKQDDSSVASREEDAGQMQTAPDKIDPLFWTDLRRYITRHHADGHRCRAVPSAMDSKQIQGEVDAQSKMLSRYRGYKIYQALFAACNPRRVTRNTPSENHSKAQANAAKVGEEVSARKVEQSAAACEVAVDVGPEPAPSQPRRSNLRTMRQKGGVSSKNRTISKEDFIAHAGEYFLHDGTIDPEAVWKDLLDPAGTGSTNLRRITRMVNDMFRIRRNLSTTLQDAEAVLASLDSFILSALLLLILLGALALYNINVIELWVSISGALLAWSFIFGNTVRVAFEAIIMIFVVNPFNVGDVVELGPNRTRYQVRRIFLYSSVLQEWDGSLTTMENQHIWSNPPITNLTSSEPCTSREEVVVDLSVISDQFMENMRRDLKTFFAEHPEDFLPEFMFHVRQLNAPLKATIALQYSHAYPRVNMHRFFSSQDVLLRKLGHLLCTHGVTYSGVETGRLPLRRSIADSE